MVKANKEVLPEHIVRRSDNKRLMVDIKVPAHLRPVIGVTNLRRSLGSSDLTREVRNNAAVIIAEFLQQLAGAERQLAEKDEATRAENERADARSYLDGFGATDEAKLIDLLDFAASGWPNAEASEAVLEEAARRVSSARDSVVEMVRVEQYISVTSARLDTARRLIERLRAPVTPIMSDAFDATLTVTELFNRFLKTETKSKDTARQYRAAQDLYLSNQQDIPINKITRQNARDYRDYLHSRTDLSHGTCDQRLKKLRAAFNFAVNEGYVPSNPFNNLAVDENTKKGHGNELDRSYIAPAMVNVTLTEILPKFFKSDSMRWPFLFYFFTGARAEEICGLRVDEVVEQWGVRCIHIRPRTEDNRTVKTDEARFTPIHDFLWNDLGLEEYVAERKRAEKTMLFDFPQWRGSDYAAQYQERMAKLRKAIEDKRGIDLGDQHTLRHNLNNLMKAAGVEEEYRNLMLGQAAKGRTNAGYGTRDATLDILRKKLHTIDISPYDFSKLR
ncbi:site-specific integrase [Azospirillum sp. B21]|uniref:site-specific integrase n=1 Tax=Azospirillum sp. B21 TaxID=2607496 RepID=UPI0011EF0E65|nr:site-specific integrase [Azospirillum sp. B21]KAA0578942.1 site-specific integrase [Azospirillum sp. B21]